jgi:hypothetical protein
MKIIILLLTSILILGIIGMPVEIEATTTGSVAFDRSVYPVPWGKISDFNGTTGAPNPAGASVFPVHTLGIFENIDSDPETLGNGDLIVHIRIFDPDFNVNAISEDVIAQDVAGQSFGPVKIKVSRDADLITLGYAGGSTLQNGTIDVGDNLPNMTRHLGSIHEVGIDSGVFQFNFTIRYTDGPASSSCPETLSFEPLVDGFGTTELSRFDVSSQLGENFCIRNGDTLIVEYTDPSDVNGSQNTVSDSSPFDLRDGLIITDKSDYLIGEFAILTLIDADFDLDRFSSEIFSMDLIGWKSDTASSSMGALGGNLVSFNPTPLNLTETGSSTGIFQTVIDIPEFVDGNRVEGEVTLEYQDWSPNLSNFVGDIVENKTVTISISIPPCVPDSGDWIINSSCTVDSDITAQGNITVTNNALVTITSGNTLTITSGNNITIQFGSGVLIKSGGTLQVNS